MLALACQFCDPFGIGTGSLQYFFPLAGTQLHAVWAHFDVAVMEFSTFVERDLFGKDACVQGWTY
jgi:hypothetical protein